MKLPIFNMCFAEPLARFAMLVNRRNISTFFLSPMDFLLYSIIDSCSKHQSFSDHNGQTQAFYLRAPQGFGCYGAKK